MANVHGKSTVVLGDDVALTGDLTTVATSKQMQTPDVTTFGNDDRVFLAGLTEGSIQIDGVYDNATGGSDEELDAALAAASGKILTVGYGGLSIGTRCSMLQAREVSYNLRAAVNDAVRVTASFTGDGAVLGGVSLHDLEQETSTGAFSSHDNSSSTSLGGVGQLHVTAFNGTDVTIKIQDSADDSNWADLITFSSVTGTTQERASVTGTVNRYLRANVTGGTFTSVTFAVSFGRLLR